MPSRHQQLRSSFVRPASVCMLLLALGCGAPSASERVPDASLARSAAAQQRFDDLEQRWRKATHGERRKLDSKLHAFLTAHGSDPIARRVRVYLAWNALANDELARAERFVGSVVAGAPGADRDLALVTTAAIALRRKRPRQALKILELLKGKIIDAGERALYHEQLALAAIEAKQWDLSMSALQDWLAASPSHMRASIEERVRELLGRIPVAVQSRQLELLNGRSLDKQDKSPAHQAARWLHDTLERRLVVSALERRDASLAQRLLEGQRRSRPSAERSAMVELAEEAGVKARIRGRTVGLALSVDSPIRQELSAATANGLLLALGLPRATQEPSKPSLLFRDVEDPTRMARTLNALAGDGAAVLVAGVDTETADLALRFANPDAAPLLLLARPSGSIPEGLPVFSMGMPSQLEEIAANRALVTLGVNHAAFVGLDGTCEPEPGALYGQFPFATWSDAKIDGIAILGSADCARRLLRSLLGTPLRPAIVFGLKSGRLYDEVNWPSPVRWLSSGRFPAAKKDNAEDAPHPNHRVDGWYQSLGFDAGTMALEALATLPDEEVSSTAVVTRIHHQTAEALRKADVSLITSSARGFSSDQTMERTLSDIAPTAARGGDSNRDR